MYEDILKTIKHHFYNVNGTPEKSAKEIASKFTRFTEWCINEVTFEHNTFFDIDGNIVDNEGDYLYTTIEHVFSYWLEHIDK